MKSQKINQYLENLQTGFIKNKTDEVIKLIYNNNQITIYELRLRTTISHQTLTSAISNLMDEGIIKITGKTVINKKHYSKFTVCTDLNEIRYNAEQRKKEKVLQWIKNADKLEIPFMIRELLKNYTVQLIQEENQYKLF